MKVIDSPSLSSALLEWTALLGATNVLQDAEILHCAARSTFPTTAKVQAIIRPANPEEVQAVVRIANRHRVSLYPISTGKNWGYGSKAPVQDAVLLDLGRMDRIVAFDEELAYVTVEPGVTQRQLYTFLRERQSRLWMDATGASPDCSIIGNTLERGFGHTPLGDHCANACGFEVVLPTGEVLETGFGRFANGKAGPIHRWGVGPSLDGLFSQSNLGIVTRMTVWLMPAPPYFQAFYFTCRDERGLGPILDALRPLRLSGTLRSAMHIGNDYKVLAATGQYPWADHPSVPLDQASVAKIREQLGIGCWNGSGGLYGTRRQVGEARRQLRRVLAGKVERLQFVDDRLLRLIGRFAAPFRLLTGLNVRRTLKVMAPVYGLMKGVPTDSTLASTYWRKKGPPPRDMDPDRDGCGLLWCSPVAPNTGAHATEIVELATKVVLDRGFEPQISISVATERGLVCVIALSYDRDVEGEDDRAFACYQTLTEQLLACGYPPYRLNVRSMGYGKGEDVHERILGSLKAILDPHGILAPGRYESPGRYVLENEPS